VPLDPVSQRGVSRLLPEPPDHVPGPGRENPADDQVAVTLPAERAGIDVRSPSQGDDPGSLWSDPPSVGNRPPALGSGSPGFGDDPGSLWNDPPSQGEESPSEERGFLSVGERSLKPGGGVRKRGERFLYVGG
jgi:hypothetical protein